MMDLKVDEEEVENGQPVSIEAFASSSTLHGLSHIFSYERLSVKRIFWTLCFLGSLAVLVFVCNERIQYYFRYPHVTKLDEVAASHMTFPAITFCNLNEFRFSRVTKNDLYHAGELLALLNSRWVKGWGGGNHSPAPMPCECAKPEVPKHLWDGLQQLAHLWPLQEAVCVCMCVLGHIELGTEVCNMYIFIL